MTAATVLFLSRAQSEELNWPGALVIISMFVFLAIVIWAIAKYK